MIVTIGRQHGSDGHAVAEALAKKLGVPCYSKEIVDHTAKSANLSRDVVSSYDEKRVLPLFIADTPFFGASEIYQLNTQIASAQFDTIRSLAAKGDAVFVGRCADYVLRGRPNLLRVFVMADQPFRIKTLMARYGLSEDQAKKRAKVVDKDRSSYYSYYTDQTWGETESYDLCLNVARLGVDGCVETIAAALGTIK